MRKTIYLIVLFFTITIIGNTQNLINNGDFENYLSLPNHFGEWDLVVGWNNANGGITGGGATPDFWHSSGYIPYNMGHIGPNSGDGYMSLVAYTGITSNHREYISTQLNTPLVVGEEYTLSFYLTNGYGGYNASRSDNFGINFSMNTPVQDTFEVLQLNPTIVVSGIIDITGYWRKYTFNFIADSTANYITFGNFKDDASTTKTNPTSTAYYFMDDVELHVAPPIEITGDSSICPGDSITLEAINSMVIGWAESLNPNNIISTDSAITVSPNVTTTYFVYSANDTSSFTVNVYDNPTIDLGNDTTVCLNEILTLDVSFPGATYIWQDNKTDSFYDVTQPGTYWVEVTSNSCISSDTIVVDFNPLPFIDLGNDTVLCQGEILELNATTPNGTYMWQDNSIDSGLSVKQSGIYWVELTVNNCSFYDSINIEFKPTPNINFGPDKVLCPSDSILLDATTSNASYLWQDNSVDSVLLVANEGEYWVEVNLDGCTMMDYIYVSFDCDIIIEMPNVFTPNNDGVNDFFVPVNTQGVSSINIVIINRWGNVVFESDNPLINWGGNEVNAGTYFWIINYIDVNGNTHEKNGFVKVLK